jgi:SAM-dependent methyltransferase
MNDGLPSAYDAFPYPGLSHVHTHPDRLATLATLFGMQPAPVEHCRVLELGSGNGTNLIAMAFSLPGSTFIGLDAAARPIAEGHRMIEELGLANVRLRRADLMDADAAQESFDYIIAHGVYSWVPGPVRDRILAIIDACLAPAGVAHVSYNTYPGCHIRDLTRRMMLFHVRATPGASRKVAQARAFLQFLATSKEVPGTYQKVLEGELDHALSYSDGAFYHDDLNPLNHPVYFHEFVAHAAEHGLQYLADAEYSDMQPENFKPAVIEALRELDDDLLSREQYLDFLTGRRFRRTLLCRRAVSLQRRIDPAVVEGLLASSNAQPVSAIPDVESELAEEFRTAKGASVTTNHPCAKAALLRLARSWPRAVSAKELLSEARAARPARVARDPAADEDFAVLSDLLLRAFASGVVELHVWAPRMMTTEVSDKPVASPVARFESRVGKRLTTLRHTGLELDDALSRELLGLLDGTRDLAALEEALAASVAAGRIPMHCDGRVVSDFTEARKILADELPRAIERLARCAVLVG